MNRKDADTARRLGPSAWRDDWMPAEETEPTDASGRTRADRAEDLHTSAVCDVVTHSIGSTDCQDDDCECSCHESDHAPLTAPRASQAAGDPSRATDGAGAAHGGDKPPEANTGPRCGRAMAEGSCPDHPDVEMPAEPRVHYEVEMYNDGWSIPIYRTDSLDDARAHEEPAVTSASTRTVRVTREVIA